jgi:NTP pyrophosphatase (non-canonical NTP hydrolase)
MDSYQAATRTTASYPEAFSGSPNAINYTGVGLGGEVGEILNKWKKILRGDVDMWPLGNTEWERAIDDLADEAGDVLWYLARFCEEIGFTLDVVAERNLTKLRARKTSGTIKGNGDKR